MLSQIRLLKYHVFETVHFLEAFRHLLLLELLHVLQTEVARAKVKRHFDGLVHAAVNDVAINDSLSLRLLSLQCIWHTAIELQHAQARLVALVKLDFIHVDLLEKLSQVNYA